MLRRDGKANRLQAGASSRFSMRADTAIVAGYGAMERLSQRLGANRLTTLRSQAGELNVA